MDNTRDYNILSSLEQKGFVLRFSSCLMSLNAESLSLAIDACRTTMRTGGQSPRVTACYELNRIVATIRRFMAKRNNNKEEELKEVIAVCDYLQLEN